MAAPTVRSAATCGALPSRVELAREDGARDRDGEDEPQRERDPAAAQRGADRAAVDRPRRRERPGEPQGDGEARDAADEERRKHLESGTGAERGRALAAREQERRLGPPAPDEEEAGRGCDCERDCGACAGEQ